MIDDQEPDATWRIVGRLIACEISTVGVHLSEGGYVVKSGSLDAF